MQDLLLTTDPDWAAYKTGDPDFLLRATGDAIRSHCGWHIAPSVTQTLDKLEVGSDGIIMLPSAYVTNVESIVFQQTPQSEPYYLDVSRYVWYQAGYIEPVSANYVSNWGYLPNTTGGLATVTLTHGYESVPNDIKQVAYELASWTASMPTGGDLKSVRSPGFSLTLNGETSVGMNLNDDQKKRLARYRIGGVK